MGNGLSKNCSIRCSHYGNAGVITAALYSENQLGTCAARRRQTLEPLVQAASAELVASVIAVCMVESH